MLECTIVVPLHKTKELTQRCLRAVLDGLAAEGGAAEVVVVDDGAARPILADRVGQVRRVARGQHDGRAAAWNRGAAAARGRYLVFLDGAAIPLPGWLAALRRHAEQHPRAAAVGSKLLHPDGSIRHAGVVIRQDRRPDRPYQGFPADQPAVNRTRRFQAVSGSGLLVRRTAFEQAGGFDPSQPGYEDVDLCLRLGEQGGEVWYCHESVLQGLDFEPVEGEGDEQSLERYRARWADRVAPDDVRYYLEDGLLRLTYEDRGPPRFEVSPLLGGLDGQEPDGQMARLLAARSRQVFELLRRVNQNGTGDGRPAGGAAFEPPVARASAEPRLLHRGRVQPLSGGAAGRLISILLPVKNGAPQLRELLPRILSQEVAATVELIAVDSGSADDSVEVLRAFGATVLGIEPEAFNHGLTRNLAASYAAGRTFVFVNQRTLPADGRWLANLIAPLDRDPELAGVCSRVLPRREADLLTARDGARDLHASAERSIRAIGDRSAYRALAAPELRRFLNFHTISAAIRPQVFARIPFRAVAVMGEDLTWARDVLEAGFKLQHEPTSVVLHSHDYSCLELLQRNFDDGLVNRAVVGARREADELLPQIVEQVRDDWRYLEQDCRLEGAELDDWRITAVLRRTAQAVGQWAGTNRERLDDLATMLSLTESIRAGRPAAHPERQAI